MHYTGLVERTIYRIDREESDVICALEADSRAEAVRLLETIADADVAGIPSTAGHKRISGWERGRYWVSESCWVHPHFGRCYVDYGYRLVSDAEPVDLDGSDETAAHFEDLVDEDQPAAA